MNDSRKNEKIEFESNAYEIKDEIVPKKVERVFLALVDANVNESLMDDIKRVLNRMISKLNNKNTSLGICSFDCSGMMYLHGASGDTPRKVYSYTAFLWPAADLDAVASAPTSKDLEVEVKVAEPSSSRSARRIRQIAALINDLPTSLTTGDPGCDFVACIVPAP